MTGRHRAVNRVHVTVPEGGRSYSTPRTLRDNATVRRQKAKVTASVRDMKPHQYPKNVEYVAGTRNGKPAKLARFSPMPARQAKKTKAKATKILTGMFAGKSTVKTLFSGKKRRVR